jgi:hypothetical protein
MNIRVHTLRTVFAVSVLLTALWVSGFVWEPLAGRDAPTPVLVVVGTLVMSGVSYAAFRGGRLLVPSHLKAAEIIRLLVPRMVGAYVVSVPVVGAVTWLLVRAFSSNLKDSEAGIFVGLMAFWLPLWFAPALAAEWSWRTMRGRGVA